MRLSRVYTEQSLQCDTTVTLKDDQAHYLGKVLRLKAGDQISLFNGDGGEFLGEIELVEKKAIHIKLSEQLENNSDPVFPIHIGIGISRGERMDYVIQKATEVGVSSITPLFTERCEVKLKGDRANNRLAHWTKVAIAACEQSGRCTPPVIEEPEALSTWLQKPRGEACFVLDHRGSNGFDTALQPKSACFLIGPEGGLADEEVTAATSVSFTPLRIGPRVLRTETAPLVAISIAQHLWGDY
jgi:16S rRNA (uracil1498-N3)-methyltransferase